MTFKLGLTGSIGMGKSTTAQMFADAGCDVWDADAAVHRMYAKGGAAVPKMGEAFPSAIVDGAVSRDVLRDILGQDSNALKVIESIVHPLVAQDRTRFISESNKEILVFDIPLLFEGGGHTEMNAVACVYVDADTQRARVLARGTMSEAQFEHILSKQMPIEQKCAKSDYIIETHTLDHAQSQVDAVIADIKGKMAHA